MVLWLICCALAAWLVIRIGFGYPPLAHGYQMLRRNEVALLASVSEAMLACACQQEEANPGTKKRVVGSDR